MLKQLKWTMAAVICAASLAASAGCSKQEASDAVKKAGDTAQDAAKTVAEDTGKVVEEGKKMAADLSDKAMAYLTPLKEKIGNLDSLKDKPAELKEAVTDLIKSIEEKAEDVQLPEKISTALATVKEKLVALKDYLEGEVEQAKVDEHIKGIMESVKSSLGISD